MEEDWDLQAVVRGCSAASTTTTTNGASSFPVEFQPVSLFSSFGNTNQHQMGQVVFGLSDPIRARSVAEELHELYKPFFPKSHPSSISICSSSCSNSPQITPISPVSSSSSFCNVSNEQQRQLKPVVLQQPKQSPQGSVQTTARSKKRKNQLKKVCQVPAENLSSDIWAWRKYGQKPIKGSPYPRGYYRCSSSKGCLARKQVERNRSDPGMFIVTYTAEHNHPAPTHRNSLAGSTRQKPSTPTTVTGGDSNKSTTKPSSPATSIEEELVVPQSTTTESKEEGKDDLLMDDEEEDEFGFSDMAVSDDFFVGLEGLESPEAGEFFSDNFPSSFSLPWVANNAAAAAGGS
ncbi:hypothetical protein UlMin_022544 [Ulmus minor]